MPLQKYAAVDRHLRSHGLNYIYQNYKITKLLKRSQPAPPSPAPPARGFVFIAILANVAPDNPAAAKVVCGIDHLNKGSEHHGAKITHREPCSAGLTTSNFLHTIEYGSPHPPQSRRHL